jgi:hypothetical protein
MSEIVLDLPVPPAANKLRRVDWASIPKYQSWKRTCDALVLAKRWKLADTQIRGKFAIDIMLDRGCRYDLDATLKATLDYLVRIELVQDDAQAYLEDIHVHWGHVPEGMRVTLRPWQEETR